MILVTGATGHVGRPLIEALLKQGENVRVLLLDNEPDLKNVEIIPGNILDIDSVKRATEGVDVIYHLAAMVDYRPVPKRLMYDVNVNGTRNILDCSKATKFIYLSTTSVYGKRMKENPANESTPYNPDQLLWQDKGHGRKNGTGKRRHRLKVPCHLRAWI